MVLDVAHNPHAARSLADGLGDMGLRPRHTFAVFAMLADKDIARRDRGHARAASIAGTWPRPRPTRAAPAQAVAQCWLERGAAKPRGDVREQSGWRSKQRVGKRGRMIELWSSDRSTPWRKRCGPCAELHGHGRIHEASEIRRRGRQRLIGAVAIVLLAGGVRPDAARFGAAPGAQRPRASTIPSKDQAPPLPRAGARRARRPPRPLRSASRGPDPRAGRLPRLLALLSPRRPSR